MTGRCSRSRKVKLIDLSASHASSVQLLAPPPPARRVWTRFRLEIRGQRVLHPNGHEFDGSGITEIPSMRMSAYPARARHAGQDEGM